MIPRSVLRLSLCLSLSVITGCATDETSGTAKGAAAAVSQFTGTPFSSDDAQTRPGSVAANAVVEPSPNRALPVPSQIRGLYLTAYTAGSAERFPELLALARSTEINTFVVDVKTEQGVHFPSELPLARELRRPGHVPITNLARLVATMHENGLYSIARIVVFKDPILVAARPDWSILRADGRPWIDREGNRWVSPWDDRVWEFNLALAEEAARAGFREIQFDYVRFPEAYPSLPKQVHPRENGDRTDAIASFLTEARRRLDPLGVIVSADVFGMSMNDAGDVGIGHQWERLASAIDHILPMAYPSHYTPTHLPGVARPNRMPYETLVTALGMAVIRNDRLREAGLPAARIIPWLQAFDAPWVDRNYPYGVEQIRAQIQAVHDVGLEDWILWDPGVRYERIAEAFAAETLPRARPYERSSSLIGRMDRYEGWGMRDERARASDHFQSRMAAP
ncbi:hypothetical protein BH23GEM6_BH23GEM6_13260 [soil metagenome]